MSTLHKGVVDGDEGDKGECRFDKDTSTRWVLTSKTGGSTISA